MLTTHVLDTFHGGPAQGVVIELRRLGESSPAARATTNADGRCGQPLLKAGEMQAGEYELQFHIGDYFRSRGVKLPQPPFLSVVVVRIGIADPDANYHVPLLASPWSYSTYRGS